MNTWHNNVIYSFSGSRRHTEDCGGGGGGWSGGGGRKPNTATDALKTTPECAPDNTDQSERGRTTRAHVLVRD